MSSALSRRTPGLVTAGLAPLRLVDIARPHPPNDGWARLQPRLAGICGSDLALLTGATSTYFGPLVSFPFTPGHEIVGDLSDDLGDLPRGTRVVVDPILACDTRGLPPCHACAAGTRERCTRVIAGHLSPGVQTGFCGDTGGGWSGELVVHRSQVHPAPDALSDRAAVLIEPLACAIHAVRRGSGNGRKRAALVVGAGTLGLLTIFVLRSLDAVEYIIAAARHPFQCELARELGASTVVSPDEATGAIRRFIGAHRLEPPRGQSFLLDGVDVAFECAGTVSALELALRTTRAGGRVVLAGLPPGGADLAPLWFRELELVGAYGASGGFATALAMAADVPLRNLVSAVYPLPAWRTAIDHALDGGRLGAVKIAFEPGAA